MRKDMILTLSSLLFIFTFAACEKTDTNLVATWRLEMTNYILTADQDFIFHDLYGLPWRGDFTIEGEKFSSSSFVYYTDNSSGNIGIVSGDIRFRFNAARLEIIYNNERYSLQEDYLFDISTGAFQARGLAENNDGQSILIDLDVVMPRRELRKDEQITVKEGFPSFPYHMLNLHGGGKLQLDYLTGDIMERLSGKWNTSDNLITIQAKGKPDKTYHYHQNGNQLTLTDKNIQTDNLPHHLSPFKDKLRGAVFQALFEME